MKYVLLMAATVSLPCLANATKAYIPNKSCPFVQGGQSTTVKETIDNVVDTLKELAPKCGEIKTDMGNLSDRLRDVLALAGLKGAGFGAAHGKHKSLLDTEVSCQNYGDAFRIEFEHVQELLNSGGSEDYPAEPYKSLLLKASQAFKACGTKEDCRREAWLTYNKAVMDAYRRRVSDKKHRCLAEKENVDLETHRKAIETALKQVGESASNIVKGADQCGTEKFKILDAALGAVGAIAGVTPALGAGGPAIALGVEVTRGLMSSFVKELLESNDVKRMADRQIVEKLSCLMRDVWNTSMGCTAEAHEREKARRWESVQWIPKETTAFFGAAADASAKMGKLVGKKLDDDDTLKDLEAAAEALRKPVQVPDPATGGYSAREIPLWEYLRIQAVALSNHQEKGPDGRVRIELTEQIQEHGANLTKLVAAVEGYIKGAAYLERPSVPPPSDDEKKALRAAFKKEKAKLHEAIQQIPDLTENLHHVLDKLPDRYAFSELFKNHLVKESRPPEPKVDVAEIDALSEPFTALVAKLQEMQEKKEAFFNRKIFDGRMPASQLPADAGKREVQFGNTVLRLANACILLPPVLMTRADLQGGVSPASSIDARSAYGWNRHIFSSSGAEKYKKYCADFQCAATTPRIPQQKKPGGGTISGCPSPRLGLPFLQRHNEKSVGEMHHEMCCMQTNYDQYLKTFLANYKAYGNPCPPNKLVEDTGTHR